MFALNDNEQDTFQVDLVTKFCSVREAPSQDKEELVTVTGLNLEHARALRLDQVPCSTKRTLNLLSRAEDQDRVIKKHEKKKNEDRCDLL